MATRIQNITEETYQTAKPSIDREAGVIRGVKILGATSKNGRDYSDRALQDAAKLYEGIGVNTNHPNRSTPNAARTVEEGVGWLENITVKPGDGVYGDLNVLKTHPMAETVFEVAERKPDRFGLSHNAQGDVAERNSRRIVESIKSVRSVDLVQSPATVNSLFESEDQMTTKTTTVKAIFEATADKALRTKRLALLEMDGMDAMGALPVDVPLSTEGGSGTAAEADLGSDASAKAAFKQAIAAIIDDEALTWEQTKAKVAQLLDTMATMAGGDGETAETGDEAVSESTDDRVKALEAKLADKEATDAARDLLESSKVKSTPARIAAIKRTPDKGERKELIEDWVKADGPAAKPGVPKPRTSPPANLYEQSDDNTYKPAQKSEELLARLR